MARHTALLLLALLAGAALARAAEKEEVPAAVAIQELTEEQVKQTQEEADRIAEDAAEILTGDAEVEGPGARRTALPDLLAAAPAPELLIAAAPAPEVSAGRLAGLLAACEVAGEVPRLLRGG